MQLSTLESRLRAYAEKYNDPVHFREDPVAFPRRMNDLRKKGYASAKDVETAAVIAAHLSWGRRSMIVRDCLRALEEMNWKPYDYVMRGRYRDDGASLHRTVKWSEFAAICGRLRKIYLERESLEALAPGVLRTEVYGQKPDPRAACKKIHLLRRWLVRRDGKVDLGLWQDTDPGELTIPLDTHVHGQALDMGITSRRQKDIRTAEEITGFFNTIFPGDPCKGDFALFGYGVTGENL